MLEDGAVDRVVEEEIDIVWEVRCFSCLLVCVNGYQKIQVSAAFLMSILSLLTPHLCPSIYLNPESM